MKKSVLFKELLLVITTIIWGMGFIFQDIGGKYLNPFTFNVARNFIAFLFLLLMVVITTIKNKKQNIEAKDKNVKELYIGGILIGTALALAMMLQQIGINYEGAGKSGFLTALYIVFVPFISFLFGKKITVNALIAVILSLAGLYFINVTEEGFSLSLGSVLLILCALAYSGQILLIDKFSPKHDSFKLSCIEFATATIILIPFMFIFDKFNNDELAKAIPSILFLGICSSGIAYTLQMYSQKEVNVTIACIIMSLESVFSLIFGLIFLKEKHYPIQYIGCVVIFISVILSQIQITKKSNEL